jgi:D-tyrosyl-tRNA(Tyr) deacylase
MRAVVQRVKRASVTINGSIHSAIESGMLILLGIEDIDGTEDILWLSKKLTGLRIFNDADGVMNRSLMETDGDVLLVSQFTLFASTKKGNRPSYIRASKPDIDKTKRVKKQLRNRYAAFLLTDRPVTIIIDTK